MKGLGLGVVSILALASAAAACSSSSSPAGSPDGGGNADGGGGKATFTSVYNDVMVPHGCNSHHIATGPDNFLDMSSQATAYKNLVGVAASGPLVPPGKTACKGSGLERVKAGDAQHSLLYLKVASASPPCGSQMPYGCPTGFSCLSSSEAQTIADWINAGAKND